MLVRMAPKTFLPRHDHPLGEQCLVLEGSIRSDDMVAEAGDFTFMPAGSTHPPLYSETGCLLLIAYT
jgi:quercetin dioxygenase-like cupin family protein